MEQYQGVHVVRRRGQGDRQPNATTLSLRSSFRPLCGSFKLAASLFGSVIQEMRTHLDEDFRLNLSGQSLRPAISRLPEGSSQDNSITASELSSDLCCLVEGDYVKQAIADAVGSGAMHHHSEVADWHIAHHVVFGVERKSS